MVQLTWRGGQGGEDLGIRATEAKETRRRSCRGPVKCVDVVLLAEDKVVGRSGESCDRSN